jgi:RNA-directed DNA polymerase
MKRHGNLWQRIVEPENIKAAHIAARRGKGFYSEVKMVNENMDEMLEQVRLSLVNKTFTTSPYQVEERFDGRKIRTIHKLPYYPDRIVQHALIQVVGPIWRSSFIRDTFQSIPTRGTDDARRRVTKAIRKDNPKYALKMDIQKYYPSVNNEKLKWVVRRKIKCKDTLWLIDNIIDSTPGLPIGNYTSQDLGNLYLCDFDWVMKHQKIKHYYRYCDDIVVMSDSKEQLHRLREEMVERLSMLDLTIKPTWQVFDIQKQGLDFVGFVFRPSHILVRRGIATKFKRKVSQISRYWQIMTPTKIVNGLMAYWGWMKHVNAKNLWRSGVTLKILRIMDMMPFKRNPARYTT